MRKYYVLLAAVLNLFAAAAHKPAEKGTITTKALFRDAVYDGAAGLVIIWNRFQEKRFMFYHSRLETETLRAGLAWVYGTKIGITEFKDGARWNYRGTANIDYKIIESFTFWAPGVIENKVGCHMYLTDLPRTFSHKQTRLCIPKKK